MANPTEAPGVVRWSRLTWLLGVGLLAAVIGAASRLSDERAFVRLIGQAEPQWLAVAALLQAGTYFAQGSIWRRVSKASGRRLSVRTAFQLGLAKLFADQALPSAGLSSSILIAKALAGRGMPPGAVSASVVLNIASYHLAYVAMLAVAIGLAFSHRESNRLLLGTSLAFLAFSVGLTAAVMGLVGQRYSGAWATWLARVPALKSAADFVSGADPRLARDGRLLLDAVALQVAIIALDVATVWTLVRALGATASWTGVFTSFMIASLVRTMGFVPGGLGTFEATSVVTLRMTGLELPVALSATLLFRGLSFWLPMVPGYWASHRITHGGT